MKKILSVVLVLVLCLSAFSSYAETSARENVKVEARKIEKTDEDLTLKILYPYLTGFKAASELNNIMQKRNIASIGYIGKAQAYIKDLKEQQKKAGEQVSNISASLEAYFDYNISGSILSVVINSYQYTGGAHGMSYLESYTVNTKTNEIYTKFSSLFNASSNYKKAILDKIYKLIDKEKDLYFDDAKKAVASKNSDYQFYIDGNKLVIYFGLYELRPYAGGMPVFEINVKELKGLLKEDIYKQMMNAKSLEKVRFNGTTLKLQPKLYEQQYTLMVPLQDIARLLGYKVTWDAKKGWGVGGGYVKNKVNSYYSDKSAGKVQLNLPPKAIGNVMYVPHAYFSTVLKEDVFYYGDAVRIYKIDAQKQSLFDKQIAEFIEPDTAEEAVEMYAKAVQDRKGAIQYALYSDTMKASQKAELEKLNWVTGVSSPWVSGYEIKKTGGNSFDIVFHWATSAGKEPDTVTKVKVTKVTDQENWQISGVKY